MYRNANTATPIRSNRYAGQCARGCGARVEAEAGALVQTARGWGAAHIGDCPTPVGGTDPKREAPKAGGTDPKVEDGYYAVKPSDGTQLCFYRLTTKVGGRWDGMQFVNRFRSDDEVHVSRPEAANVRAAIRRNPKAALDAFASELGRCYRCGRTLTDEVSRALGIGPDCRSK